MPDILALDTATEACSVALSLRGEIRHLHEVIPRQHSHRLFSMLRELLPNGQLRAQGIELLAYNHGPGSFTGLRIAASAVQGLAFSNDLPVAGISTLECMARGAWRTGYASADDTLLILLDARINEVYWGLYELRDGAVHALVQDSVAAPARLPADLAQGCPSLLALGSGVRYLPELPASLHQRIRRTHMEFWPDSLDLLSAAAQAWDAGKLLSAEQVIPVYLRDEIGWKKIAEQGPQ